MLRQTVVLIALAAGAFAQVKQEDVVKGPGADWLTYAGTYSGWRYSPLKQVTAENAKNLVPKWVYHVPGARGLRSSPIVYQGVIYITDTNSVYAIDGRSGRLVWQYADRRAKEGGVNRGAAIWGDRIYFTSSDNYLVALDRHTGAFIFSKKFADRKSTRLNSSHT